MLNFITYDEARDISPETWANFLPVAKIMELDTGRPPARLIEMLELLKTKRELTSGEAAEITGNTRQEAAVHLSKLYSLGFAVRVNRRKCWIYTYIGA